MSYIDELFKAGVWGTKIPKEPEWVEWIHRKKYLQEESERQALEKYTNGNYELGKLDQYGQRISIRISIPRKNTGEMVSYVTGWMVLPNGQIRLNTPYGGK